MHKEARLREAFGDEYENYRKSGVPFYIPYPTGTFRGSHLGAMSERLDSSWADAIIL